MEARDYQEINELLASLEIREESININNKSNKNEKEQEFLKASKNVENVFMRDLNFFQGKGNSNVTDTRFSVQKQEKQEFASPNDLLNERGFMPTSSVFPGNVSNRINAVREDIPLSTRVISKKKQYTNEH
jgi:ABC-type polar amino acid transport system ATPase subunit